MEVLEAIRSRRTLRGFKSNPVPKKIIKEILENSIKIPSAMNSQPCGIAVVAGKVLENIGKENTQKLIAGDKPNPDIPRKPYEGLYRTRQKELAAQIFSLTGIGWEEKEKQAAWIQKGFRFYDAPVALILYIEKSVDQSQALISLGALCQNICLLALDYGLGTCIEDMGVGFPEVVRKYTGIPESKNIVVGIAIGYLDWDHPINRLAVKKEPVENFVSWFISD